MQQLVGCFSRTSSGGGHIAISLLFKRGVKIIRDKEGRGWLYRFGLLLGMMITGLLGGNRPLNG